MTRYDSTFEDFTRQTVSPQSGRVFVFPGSGTAGWEAAIGNCLSPRDMVLTSSFGQFSGLWVDMCRRFRLNAEQGTLCFRPETADEPRTLLPMDPAIRIEHVFDFKGQSHIIMQS